jgi:hypothetical protein
MTGPQRGMTLFHAILRRDHDRIDELSASGEHPLTWIERCIEARGDAIHTLMRHVDRDCEASRSVVRRVLRHLTMIGNYPVALGVLEHWLEGTSS